MERLGCRRLRTEGRAAAAAERATVTQWAEIEGIIVARGCRQRVCLDFLKRNAVLSMLLSSATAAMAAGGLRCFVWDGDVRCLGSSGFPPGMRLGLGSVATFKSPQAWTQELSADPSVFTGPSQPLETAYAFSYWLRKPVRGPPKGRRGARGRCCHRPTLEHSFGTATSSGQHVSPLYRP